MSQHFLAYSNPYHLKNTVVNWKVPEILNWRIKPNYFQTHRPVHMRKDFIQQRFRRKTKEEESTQQSVMFQQLLGMAAGQMPNPAAFTFLEQFNQMHNAQEQLNTSAPV